MKEGTSAEENARILHAYAARRERVARGEVDPLRYTCYTPGYLFAHQLLERRVVKLLGRYGLRPIGDRRILDVGCGDGVIGESEGLHLHDFLVLGARPENLYGVDIQAEQIELGRMLLPGSHLLVGAADELPFADQFFDVVGQWVAFSSILDDRVRRRAAAEMRRVLRPGGLILWYDLRFDNPRNADVRRISRNELHSLFPNCELEVHSCSLPPPAARALARYSWLAAAMLESIRPLRSHYLAAVKPVTGP